MSKAGLVLTIFKQRLDLDIKQKRTVFGCVALCALTLFAFSSVVQNGLINYDDGEYITANPHVLNGLNWTDIKWAFTTTRASNWTPVAWLSHMLDVQLFGLNPHYHHLISLLFHTANTLLLFLLLQAITGSFPNSFLVAALFAIHPLHVESVAWASERKDLLSALFFLLTIWTYAAYTRRQPGENGIRINSRPYFLSLIFYALGLMSKPMLVTLPFLLLLVDFWPLTRIKLDRKSVV